MTLHLSAKAAKDGGGTAITGGVNFNDESGAGTGPFDQAVVLIDSTQNEILGTTADAVVAAGAAGSLSAKLRAISRDIVANIVLAAGSALIGIVKIGDGTNSAAIKAASTAPVATDPAVVVAISPNSVNSNGRKTPANSAPVVEASRTYATVAASQSAQVLGSTGAIGDQLDGLLIVPATAAAGAVSITDGSGSAITVFAGGGTTPLPTLAPIPVQIGALSSSGAWKVTTGTNVSVIAVGNFT